MRYINGYRLVSRGVVLVVGLALSGALIALRYFRKVWK